MLPLAFNVPTAAAQVTRDAPSADDPSDLTFADVHATRRKGIAAGITLGAGLGIGDGYPNNSEQIGDPQFHAATRWLPGTSEALLILGALTDGINFGFWYEAASYQSGSEKASTQVGGLRVEGFPLLALAPRFEGLGVFGQFGLASGKLSVAGRPESQGTQSLVGFGAFYEWSLGHFLGGHLGLGPSLEYDALFTQPLSEHGVLAAARIVFYGGP